MSAAPIAGKWSSRAKRLGAVLFGVLAGFTLVELGVRLVEPGDIGRDVFETTDPILHHKFIPEARGHYRGKEFFTSYSINSLGLRDREISLAKPAGIRRVLVIGDSFTEGIGVEAHETFPNRLQAMLERDGLGGRWQVINAGVASYSPLLEYLYLKNGGLALEPDLVILSFDLSDVNDDIMYTALARFDGRGDPIAVAPDPEATSGSWSVRTAVSIKDFFKKHTRTYGFIRFRLNLLLQKAAQPTTFSGDVRSDKYAMVREGYEPTHRDWALSYKYLLMIRDLLKAHGVDFLMTVHPYGMQVSPREWGEGRGFWGFERGAVYSTVAQDYVTDFARENDIAVINLCDYFRTLARTAYPIFLEYDGHWRAAGHDLVASVLYRHLLPYASRYEARGVAPTPSDALK